jgi:histidinol phosphatase-like PHP family hydrolase
MFTAHLETLPDDVIGTHRVLTHVHTAGNSVCSGQQTAADVARLAKFAGYEAVVLNEHTGNPGAPTMIWLGSEEHVALAASKAEAQATVTTLLSPLLWGLETNVVLTAGGPVMDVDRDVLKDMGPAYVIGSLHGDPAPYQDPATALAAYRVLFENPWIDAIGHPTRGLPTHLIDWDEFYRMAVDTGTAVELNLNQWYKDTGQNNGIGHFDGGGERKHRRLLDKGVTAGANFIFGSDIHNPGMWPLTKKVEGWETTQDAVCRFNYLLHEYGAGPDNILNTSYATFAPHLHLDRL